MIDSDRLRAFVTFCDTLNLTRAAEALHIAQPSLHAKLARLADEVGGPLYRREGRGLLLTALGERVRAHGREMVDRDAGFAAELRGERDRPVVLAAGVGVLRYLLLDRLVRHLDPPAPPVRLRCCDAEQTRAMVHGGRAHLGAGVLVDPDLETAVLARVGAGVVLPVDHRHADRKRLRPLDLEGESLIVPAAGRPQREAIDRTLDGVDWTVAVEARGWDLALHLASRGLGLAVVNDFCPPPPGMRLVPLPALGTVTYRLAWRAGALPTHGRKLRDALLDQRA
jgi:DNA-binding transcriptional LysR family regulator